jgi:hypothetical protein
MQLSAKFKFEINIQKSSIDRQEIIIIIKEFRAKRGSRIIWNRFDNFRRIFLLNVTHRSRILKILIFINNIIKIYKLYDIIRTE